MITAERIQTVLDEVAAEGMAQKADLWPRISAGLIKSARQRRVLLSRAVIFLVMVLIPLLIFVLIPLGRVVAESIGRFFQYVPGNTIPAPTQVLFSWVEMGEDAAAPKRTKEVLPACSAKAEELCGLEQVRVLSGWKVRTFASLPPGWAFARAWQEDGWVSQMFIKEDGQGMIILAQSDLPGEPAFISRDAAVEEVRVRDGIGQYVRGAFAYRDSDAEQTWVSNAPADQQRLRWKQDGWEYSLLAMNTGLDRNDLVRLAEGLSASVTYPLPPSEAKTEKPQPAPTSPTLAELEKEAGYSVKTPGRLPDTLHFGGAEFVAEKNILRICYPFLPYADCLGRGLVITQQPIPPAGDFELQPFQKVKTGDTPVMAAWSVGAFETIAVHGQTAQYAQGVWNGTDCCGWVWEGTEYARRLRWQADGLALEISSYGGEFSREDLILIAEAMR